MPCIAPPSSFQVLVIKDFGGEAKLFKPRKQHTKTKLGCVACRAKRVKCDENKPNCLRCLRNGRCCVYDKALSTLTSITGPITLSKRIDIIPQHRLATTTLVPFPLHSSKSGTSALHLLSHLVTHAPTILSMPQASTTLVLTLSQSSSLIRNALLALAACHLRCGTLDVAEYRVAEHFQQAVTLAEFQRLLGTKQEELGQERANAMIMCAMLLNILAFVLPSRDDGYGTAWRDRSRSNSSATSASTPTQPSSISATQSTSTWNFDWLGLQAGLRPFFVYMAPYVSRSIAFMEDIFLTSSDSDAERARHPTWAAAALAQGYRQMPELWAEHFGIPRCGGEEEGGVGMGMGSYTSGIAGVGAGDDEDEDVAMDRDAVMDADARLHNDCLGPSAPLMFRQDAITMHADYGNIAPANTTTTTTTNPSPHNSLAYSPTSSSSFPSKATNGSDVIATSTSGNIYTIPASILSFLHGSNTQNTQNTNIFPLLQFATKATPAFRLALSMRDERALWLYCYWLKLMRDVYPNFDHGNDGGDGRENGGNGRGRRDGGGIGGTWWSRPRVAQEWGDVGGYLLSLRLEGREGMEGRRWARLMEELGFGSDIL